MRLQGRAKFDNFNIGQVSYSDSKLYVLILCKAAARLWTNVYANAVDPGWVPTKMGGGGAPDDCKKDMQRRYGLPLVRMKKQKLAVVIFFIKKNGIVILKVMIFCCRKNSWTYVKKSRVFQSLNDSLQINAGQQTINLQKMNFSR